MQAVRFLICLAFVAVVSAAMPARAEVPGSSIEKTLAQARTVLVSDPDAGLVMVSRAEAEARQLPSGRERTIALATGLWLRAETDLRAGRTAAAERELSAALKMIEPIREPIELRGDLLKAQGAFHVQKGDAASALASFQRAYAIYQTVGAARSQSIVLQHMASLYSSANDNVRAERYYRQASEAYAGDPALSLMLHNNRGNVLLQLERHAEAQQEYGKALALARRTGSALLEIRILGNLASNQVEAGKLDEAERTLAQGFRLAQASGATQEQSFLYAAAARIAFNRGDLAKAVRLIDRSFAGIDPRDTSIAFRDSHLFAYQIYKKAGRTRLALDHLEALRRLNDEASKVATSNSAALMAARFDYANQEARIATLRAEEATRRAQFQQILSLSLGAAAVVVVGLLTYFLVTIRRSRNEVRAANADLAQTNVALEKALAAKTEFLATTSHEIRTPLNGILGMTQVMLADPALPAVTRDRIGVVHRAGVTMRALVDDILDVAKMETGHLTIDPTPLNLPAMLQDVSRMWEEQAKGRGVGFDLELAEAPAWIVSDAGRLRQIVFNLLSNALKFTEQGAIGLVARQAEGRLHIEVRDSGIGIPEDKREAIFESFKQADSSTTRKFGGTGLGLTICRNLAHAMGGEIRVGSVEGEGSVFTVELPLVLAEPPATTPMATKASVLIVDRNPIARAMLRTLVEARGVAPYFAATLDEAQAALAEGRIDTVIADEATLRVDRDPFEAVAALANAARGANVRSLLLWPALDEELSHRLQALGADLVIGKPVSAAVLIDKAFPMDAENSANAIKARLVSQAA